MFKEEFKYYKSKRPPPDLRNVLDFCKEPKEVNRIKLLDKVEPFFCLNPPSTWEIYEIKSNPGLIFIRNPFTTLGELYLAARCLRDYTKRPNKSNLDVHGVIGDDEDWWSLAKTDEKLLKRLRWITFGYHHNWDTKVYEETNKSEFPTDLSTLCTFISAMLKFENFQPQAAIVNYYHADSTLSGHTDHSEQNLDAPLFSFSFGQTAIFLIGGKSVIEKPTAMFIRSGDIVVMSKEARLCYHGVPKILTEDENVWKNVEDFKQTPNEFNLKLIKELSDPQFREDFVNYLRQCRININVRQVLNEDQLML